MQQVNGEVLRFKGHVEGGLLIPEEGVSLPDGTFWVSLQKSTDTELDALDEIIAMAEPIGPADLARHFDAYTGRVISDESPT